MVLHKISACVVLYNTPAEAVLSILASLNAVHENTRLYLVDNSPVNTAQLYAQHKEVEYIYNQENIGYGSAHNIAMQKSLDAGFQYHFILNPDITFQPNVISEICSFLDQHADVGLVMPKVLYSSGDLQYLCKLLPTPADLFARRFLPEKLIRNNQNRFELRTTGYNKIMDVPFLSGCFMALRREAIQQCGMFDERFFMYGEDIDFSRRIHKKFRTIFYPYVSIVHGHAAASYKSFKMLRMHTVNIIRYFNKWGWFFDPERKKINAKILKALNNG